MRGECLQVLLPFFVLYIFHKQEAGLWSPVNELGQDGRPGSCSP